ncbi:ArsR/SmtB family transcription factor [Streptomyces fragilis]|uniref:DUF5937 family protein n=1 Tax=Streptomyces fragilis TaxID=67301 RepID=A0ABV2YEK1_9ACTN|nr:DUF5937 family protein [Streptomyces fragilis]
MEAELTFSATDLAQTRFAVSPMWEVVTSFRLLSARTEPPPHRGWLAQVRPRVREAGLDRGWLAALVPPRNYLADFLTPLPAAPFASLAEELDAIRGTDPARVRADVACLLDADPEPRAGVRLRLLERAPEAALDKLAAEIGTYWEVALAPYWARIRKLLEADVFHRARQTAEHGSAHVLNDLHDSVRWDDGALRLLRRQAGFSRTGSGPGLLLVPSAFTWPGPLTRAVPPEPPQVAYPARGVGLLWEGRTTASTDAIAAVLGRSRALLLAELDVPASTTDLARHCGLSPAGVSQHLTALRDAGLVTAHRNGRRVLYARTAVADALLCPPVA